MIYLLIESSDTEKQINWKAYQILFFLAVAFSRKDYCYKLLNEMTMATSDILKPK